MSQRIQYICDICKGIIPEESYCEAFIDDKKLDLCVTCKNNLKNKVIELQEEAISDLPF